MCDLECIEVGEGVAQVSQSSQNMECKSFALKRELLDEVYEEIYSHGIQSSANMKNENHSWKASCVKIEKTEPFFHEEEKFAHPNERKGCGESLRNSLDRISLYNVIKVEPRTELSAQCTEKPKENKKKDIMLNCVKIKAKHSGTPKKQKKTKAKQLTQPSKQRKISLNTRDDSMSCTNNVKDDAHTKISDIPVSENPETEQAHTNFQANGSKTMLCNASAVNKPRESILSTRDDTMTVSCTKNIKEAPCTSIIEFPTSENPKTEHKHTNFQANESKTVSCNNLIANKPKIELEPIVADVMPRNKVQIFPSSSGMCRSPLDKPSDPHNRSKNKVQTFDRKRNNHNSSRWFHRTKGQKQLSLGDVSTRRPLRNGSQSLRWQDQGGGGVWQGQGGGGVWQGQGGGGVWQGQGGDGWQGQGDGGVWQGQGDGAWQGQGDGAWQGQGGSAWLGQGLGAWLGLGAWQGQGLGAWQGQGLGAWQGQGLGAWQGQGLGARQGQGRGAWQGQGRGAWQGQGRGAWQGQGGGAWQSQGCTFPGNSNCINEQQSKYRALKFQQKHTKNNIRVNPISRFSNGGTWPKSLQSRANVTELCNHKSDKASSIVTEQAGIKQCDENGEVGTKCGISNVKCNKLDMVDRGENITLGENGASQERDNGESAIMFNETEVQCDEVQHHSCMHDSEDVKQDKSQNCQQSTNSLESAINTEDCKLLDGIAHDQAIKILETSDSNKNTSFKKDNLSEEEDECCILTSRKLFCPSLNSTVIFEDANELPAILKSGENTVCNKTEEQCDEMQCDEDQHGEDQRGEVQRGEVQRDEVQHHSNIHDSEDVKNYKNHNSQQNIKSLEPAINTEDCNLLGGIAHDQAIEILETSDSNKSASFKKNNFPEDDDECCILNASKSSSLNSTVIFEDVNELPAILKSNENNGDDEEIEITWEKIKCRPAVIPLVDITNPDCKAECPV